MEEELDHFSEEEMSIKDEPSETLIIEDFGMPEVPSSSQECEEHTSIFIKSEPQSPIADEAGENDKYLEKTGDLDQQETDAGALTMSENQTYFLRSLTRTEVAEELNLTAQRELEQKSQRKRGLDEDEFEHEILSYLRANCGRNEAATHDPDEMFLFSQLPLIRKFSLADKADFQVKVIQLLQSYSLPSK